MRKTRAFADFGGRVDLAQVVNIGVARGRAPLAAPRHRAPHDLFGGVRYVGSLVNDGRVHATQFEQDRREIFRCRARDDFADHGAAGKKDKVERQLQKLGILFFAAGHDGHNGRVEIFGDQIEQHEAL